MARILVVEDDKPLQEVYADALKAQGFEVDTADDGEEGLSKIKQGGYDVVLLDIILPKLSGIDVMEQLRNQPPVVPNKYVIFLTNLDKSETISRGLHLANGYLIKSQITPGDLIREVNFYLTSGGSPNSVVDQSVEQQPVQNASPLQQDKKV